MRRMLATVAILLVVLLAVPAAAHPLDGELSWSAAILQRISALFSNLVKHGSMLDPNGFGERTGDRPAGEAEPRARPVDSLEHGSMLDPNG
jgi:hypothetical protein